MQVWPVGYRIHAEPRPRYDAAVGDAAIELMRTTSAFDAAQVTRAVNALGLPNSTLTDMAELVHLFGASMASPVPTRATDMISMMQYMSITSPIGGLKETKEDIQGKAMEELNGHARTVAALLILLNLRDHIAVVETRPRRRGMFRYKQRQITYAAETVVRIKIPEPKVIRALYHAARQSELHRRRHSVRGHWAVSVKRKGDITCPHVFIALDHNHSECDRCGAKRWFRKAHYRGDASLGFVTHAIHSVEAADGRH
jgi:hypothetical protein